MDEKTAWVCFTLAGIGPVYADLIRRHFSPVSEALGASVSHLIAAGLPRKIAEGIADWENLPWQKELEEAEAASISLVPRDDHAYPSLLARIPDPPPLLYVKGSFSPADTYTVAIVGTRNPSVYGIRMAERFARELAGIGCTVASGVARGIDTAAHRGALAARGRTIGVLGSGILSFYPPENKHLGDRIAEHGALISEFPLHTPPLPANFPRRNRIISGLSRGVLVVEAGQKSGALITAGIALEQNREVFALPGRIGELVSTGTNALLKEGATLVERVEDILEELNIEVQKTPSGKPEKAPVPTGNEEESAILRFLEEPRHVEEIAATVDLPAGRLTSLLLRLELAGRIRSLPGKRYRKSS